jgi:hypothetical protein
LGGSEHGEGFWGDEYFDTSGGLRLSADEALAFEGQDHLVDGGRGGGEEVLQVAFGGWAGVDLCVGPDEGEVLALLVGKGGARG